MTNNCTPCPWRGGESRVNVDYRALCMTTIAVMRYESRSEEVSRKKHYCGSKL